MRISRYPINGAKPKEFSFEEMTKQEGIYQVVDGVARFIVLRCINVESSVVLYVGTDQIQPAAPKWHSRSFIKLDKKLCLDII